jgi:hypothetical protein
MFIARAKQLGCSLEEIAKLVRAWDTEDCAPVQHRLRTQVMAKVAELQQQLADTMSFLAELQATAALLNGRAADGPCDADCGCSTAPSAAPATTESTVTYVPRRPIDDAPPIACSLTVSDGQERIADWQAVLALVESRRAIERGVRLEFGPAVPTSDVARLAAAEYACCPFFGFAVTVDRRGMALEVTAPPHGQTLLASVFGVAGASLAP